ncbi:hypothetical protein V495_04212 [Pseudogymnoascus sp. VKM F-4514 (FW-929)]|nr:hypothetical protein V495_04212 [Pseudogymnoascus sp. VKM F-4514 (FW-929)]KFY56998.1 hypothetical protein V497_05828 [Pseudogymnoascus sp. VKM F-4516 (FW-969)]
MPYSILSRVSRPVRIPPTVSELPMVNFGHNGLDWSEYTMSGDRSASQHQNNEPAGTTNGHTPCEKTLSTTSSISVASFDYKELDLSQYTLSGNQFSPQHQNDELAGTTIRETSCEQDPPTASAISSNSSDYFYCPSYFDCAPITQGRVGEDIMDTPCLPPYITPLPPHLDKTVLRFLFSNGALSVPSAEFRHICASRYLELLHPLFPLLDLHNLLTITQRGNNNCGTISLLLFNAVICAALAFVENDHVIRAGYPSKRAARMSFFKRAKLLFDFDIEPDRFISIQAALLLSNWYPGIDEKKDPWFWSGTAISLGHTIGLHLNPVESKVGKDKIKIWRRLWWTSFCREQKLALALGRPSRLTYYNVPMLTLDDFDIGALPDGALYLECTYSGDVARQKELALLCIEHTKLCICICHVVSSIFANRRKVDGNSQNIYNGIYSQAPYEDMNSCAKNIEQWLMTTPKDLQYENVSKEKYDIADRCLIMAKANIYILYYGAIAVLHGHKTLNSGLSWEYSSQQGQQQIPQRIVREASSEITRVNQNLYELGLLPYSSTTAVGTVVAAAMVHVLDLTSTKSPPPPVVPDGIQKNVEFLQILQEAYGTAVSALQFLRAAAQSAGISILETETKNMLPTDTPSRQEELQKLFPIIPASTPSNLLPASPSWGMRDELFGQSYLNNTEDMDFFGDIYMLDFDRATELDQLTDLGFTDTSFKI